MFLIDFNILRILKRSFFIFVRFWYYLVSFGRIEYFSDIKCFSIDLSSWSGFAKSCALFISLIDLGVNLFGLTVTNFYRISIFCLWVLSFMNRFFWDRVAFKVFGERWLSVWLGIRKCSWRHQAGNFFFWAGYWNCLWKVAECHFQILLRLLFLNCLSVTFRVY